MAGEARGYRPRRACLRRMTRSRGDLRSTGESSIPAATSFGACGCGRSRNVRKDQDEESDSHLYRDRGGSVPKSPSEDGEALHRLEPRNLIRLSIQLECRGAATTECAASLEPRTRSQLADEYFPGAANGFRAGCDSRAAT